MKELANLAARDSTSENREFWKSEMSSALREIQDLYDSKIDAIRNEMESQFTMRVRLKTSENNSRKKTRILTWLFFCVYLAA